MKTKSKEPVHTDEYLNIALEKANKSLEVARQSYCFSPNSYTNEGLHAAIEAKLAIEAAIESFENFRDLISAGLESLASGEPLEIEVER